MDEIVFAPDIVAITPPAENILTLPSSHRRLSAVPTLGAVNV